MGRDGNWYGVMLDSKGETHPPSVICYHVAAGRARARFSKRGKVFGPCGCIRKFVH
jgi:hypothetical protein